MPQDGNIIERQIDDILRAFGSFMDADPGVAEIYYRLKMVDTDGKYLYSNVILVNAILPQGIVLSKISPNPFISSLNLTVVMDSDFPLNLQLTDLTGRTIYKKLMQGKKGENIIRLNDLAKLPVGIYYLRITAPGALINQKLLKWN